MMISRLLLICAFVSVAALQSHAQDVPVLDDQPVVEADEATVDPVILEGVALEENVPVDDDATAPVTAPEITSEQKRSMSLMQAYPQMSSLFFSRWEHDLIIDARLGLNVRPPESPIEDLSSPASIQAEDSTIRELALGGIVYHSSTNWTFWLNGLRITPTGLPEQVMNLKVFKDYIEIEWLDTSTNQIYPIRLRPHQRFNLDSRIFLPG